ncbi:MAG TPA: PilZ domain-containing protein [Candidatus Omnitrophota bacterium]|nr:PilZ domain-containing protein [Candidatus Omnitrophota bacterium]
MEFESQMTDNRRVYPRMRFKDAVRFEQKDQAQFGGSVALDLSSSGLRMRFNDYVPVGTELVLQIHLNEEKIVECMGKVVWVTKYPYSDHYQAGLEFESPENLAESKAKIHRYYIDSL